MVLTTHVGCKNSRKKRPTEKGNRVKTVQKTPFFKVLISTRILSVVAASILDYIKSFALKNFSKCNCQGFCGVFFHAQRLIFEYNPISCRRAGGIFFHSFALVLSSPAHAPGS